MAIGYVEIPVELKLDKLSNGVNAVKGHLSAIGEAGVGQMSKLAAGTAKAAGVSEELAKAVEPVASKFEEVGNRAAASVGEARRRFEEELKESLVTTRFSTEDLSVAFDFLEEASFNALDKMREAAERARERLEAIAKLAGLDPEELLGLEELDLTLESIIDTADETERALDEFAEGANRSLNSVEIPETFDLSAWEPEIPETFDLSPWTVEIPETFDLSPWTDQMEGAAERARGLRGAVQDLFDDGADVFPKLGGHVRRAVEAFDLFGQAGGILEGVFEGLSGVGFESLFAPGAFIAAAKAFNATLKPLIRFAKASGESAEQIAAFRENMKELGRTSDYAIEEMAAVGEEMLRAGYSTEQVASEVENLFKAADAAQGEASDFLEFGVLAQRIFGDTAGSVGDAAKKIAGFALKTGNSVEDVAASFESVERYAREANQSLDSTMAAWGLLVSLGADVGSASEGLGAALTSLRNFTLEGGVEATGLLKQLGISKEDIQNADGEIRPFLEIVERLKSAIAESGATQGESEAIIRQVFGETEAETFITALRATTDEINTLNQAVDEGAGFADKLAGGQYDPFGNIAASINTIAINMGEVWAKELKKIADTVSNLLKPLDDFVGAIATLPKEVHAFAGALFVAVPLLNQYAQAMSVSGGQQAGQSLIAKGYGGLLKVLNGEITVATARQALYNKVKSEGQKASDLATKALKVFRGEITLQEAAQRGVAKGQQKLSSGLQAYREAAKNTAKHAGELIKKHGKLAATVGLAVVAFGTLRELFRKSAGAQLADEINAANEAFVRANAESLSFQEKLDVLGDGAVGTFKAVAISAEEGARGMAKLTAENKRVIALGKAIQGARDSLADFGKVARERGTIEAVRTVLAVPTNAEVGADRELGTRGRFATGEQVGNQRAVLAYERSMASLNIVYQDGIDLLMKYRDGQKLSAEEQEAFEKSAENQIATLEKQRLELEAQEPPNERLAQLRDNQISLIERQQASLRGRIASLNEEGGVIESRIIPTYQEVIDKYEEMARARSLLAGESLASIEEGVASGLISEAVAERRRLEVRRAELLAAQKQVQDRVTDLQASAVGLTGEDADAAEEEIAAALQEQLSVRQELATTQQDLNALIAGNKIEEARSGIVAAVNEEKRNQLAVEREIAAAGLAGEDVERRRLELSKQSLQQELEANRAAAAALEGATGPGIEDERGKLEDERVNLELELTRIAQQENQKRVEAEKAAAEEAAEARRAAVEKAAADRMSALDREKKGRIEAVRAAGLAEGEEARRILEIEGEFAQRRMEALEAQRAEIAALADSRALTEEEAADRIGDIDRELTEERIGLSERRREAEVAAVEAATEAAVKAIEERLTAEKSALESREASLGFASDDLDLQRELADARRSLADVEEERADSRLQHALELAEISEDEAAIERAKSAIYADQLADIEREAERKRENLAIAREQSALELDRKEATAEIAILEAQANVAKAEAQSAAEAELASLRQILDIRRQQLGRIDAERANAEAVSGLRARQIEAERELGVEQARQAKTAEERRAQVEAEKAAEEAKGEAASETAEEQERQKEILDAIAASYDRQTEALTLQSDRLQLTNDLLSEQSNLLSGRAEMESAVGDLALQRLNFQLEAAKLAEDEEAIAAATESIRKQELDSLLARQEADRRSLILKQEQERVAVRQKKLAAEIAVLEARANVEKARAEGKSAKEIEALSKIAALRKEQLSLAEEQAANLEDAQAMEAVTQTAEQQAAREGLEQGYALEDARAAAQKLAEDEKAREEGGEGTLSSSERGALERDLESVTEAPPLETDPEGIRNALTETLTAQREADSKALSEMMESQNRGLKDSLAEIREVLANRKTVENLTVVSADPMSDAASVIDDLNSAGALSG